ncbi:hypothetical protein [Rhodococcus sp. Eu-32]|uniref:hypothetical protein n=1 Tax=Rhodococcus sp. Eu-32 TaxID=1017319 RepID=UPI00140419EE|nr:hypothetical protein [Rhodococcus sp. Eu-32]
MNETIGQLPAKWRARAEGEPDAGYQCALGNCADELDEALKVTGENIIATFKALGDAL